MSTRTPKSLHQLARLVPDLPRWIDLRGLLLNGRCDVWCDSDPERGFVTASRDFPFAVLYGRPDTELVSAAVSEAQECRGNEPSAGDWQLLAAPEERDYAGQALPGWRHTSIAMHGWTGSLRPPASFESIEIVLLRQGTRSVQLSLAHLPESSRRELSLDWVSRRPAVIASAGSSLVSICWAAFTTETLWDVAIETAEPFRRRGLAAACFLTLARHMGKRGLSPAWGAAEDNPASLQLAAKLGFAVDGYLDSWCKPIEASVDSDRST